MSMIKQLLCNDETLLFIFNDNHVLTTVNPENPSDIRLVSEDLFQKCLEHHCAKDWFFIPEMNYGAMFLEEGTPHLKGTKWITLRSLFAQNNSNLTLLASHAHALLNWRAQTRFCSKCGSPLADHRSENARYCFNCDRNVYPSISPCIIVRITNGDKILLARHTQRNTDVYTCLAGYIEPGETLEQCVEREVFEETGIKVKNIKYIESQSWPFPDQLMLGFSAEYDGGEPKLQPEEIQEIFWFTKDNLPAIPKPGSLAYKLITS
jgi:NAD+ diphosphatase